MLRKADGTPVQAISHVFGSPLVLIQHQDGTQESIAIALLTADGGPAELDQLIRQVRLPA